MARQKLMSKKNIIIYITAAAFLLIISITSILFSMKIGALMTETKNTSEALKKTEEELVLANNQEKKYKYLLDNFNNILFRTIYYGRAESENGKPAHFFTGFGLFYKEKFYLITAGHSVELEGIKYKNFRFKPNNRDIWISPELVYYVNDLENNNDFAIFQDIYVLNGLYCADVNLKPEFIVGNTTRDVNIVKEYTKEIFAVNGESGSPVLNSECRVVGVLIKNTGEYTDISKVIAAIEKTLKN